VIRRERPVESRSDLVWLDPPRLLSPHRSMFVVAYDRAKPLPSWLADELAEQTS
jgi:hypothetical protein